VPEEDLKAPLTTDLEMNAAIVPGHQQANAVTATTNVVTAGACPQSTKRCADGTCAVQCTNTKAVGKTEARYHMEFRPNPGTLVAAPNIAAPPSAYLNRAATLKAGEDAASFSAVTHAEVSQGLVDAAQDSKQAERAEEIAAQKAKVDVQFNTAAAKGGIYKKRSQEDDQAIVQVKTARLHEQEAEKEEKAAEAALAKARKKTHQAKVVVSNKEELERRAKYAAEFAGQEYERVKADAVASDNALKEREHEAAQEQKFRAVARAAVVAEAQKEASMDAKLMHAHKSPPAVAAPATATGCSDCKTLDKKYKELGGSCADCPTWASAGHCTSDNFKKFMGMFCAGSCKLTAPNCPELPAQEETLIQMPESSVAPL